MAYIEENMQHRRSRELQSADTDTDTDTNAASTTAAGASASVRPNKGNAQDDVFDKLDPRYKVERKLGEEGSVTNSLAMLTAIPEVDLGMECVPSLLDVPSFSNIMWCVLMAIPLPARVCETSKRRKRPSSHSRTAARATTERQTMRRTSPPRAVRFFFLVVLSSPLASLMRMRSLPPRVAGQVGRRHHPRCQARSTRAPPGTRGGRSYART